MVKEHKGSSNDISRLTDIRVAAYKAYAKGDARQGKLKADAFIKGALWADKHLAQHSKEASDFVKQFAKEYHKLDTMCKVGDPCERYFNANAHQLRQQVQKLNSIVHRIVRHGETDGEAMQ